MSGVSTEAIQSLPQCRQWTLHRNVDSQNNCCSGCSFFKFCRRHRSSHNAVFKRRFMLINEGYWECRISLPDVAPASASDSDPEPLAAQE